MTRFCINLINWRTRWLQFFACVVVALIWPSLAGSAPVPQVDSQIVAEGSITNIYVDYWQIRSYRVELTLHFFPQNLAWQGNLIVSQTANYEVGYHFMVEAVDSDFGTEVYDLDIGCSVENAPASTQFNPADGSLLYLSMPLCSSEPDTARPYNLQIFRSGSRTLGRFWAVLPFPYVDPNDAFYNAYSLGDVAATISGTESSFTGRVTNCCTGDPISDATVAMINGTALFSRQTDGTGGFSIEGIPPGPLTVTITKAGYQTYGHTAILPAFTAVQQDFCLNPLQIYSVDTEDAKNKADHHSDKYGVADKLVLRRATNFLVRLTLPCTISAGYDVAFQATDTFSTPPVLKDVPVVTGDLPTAVWAAAALPGGTPSNGKKLVEYKVNIPADAAVGEYQFSARLVATSSGDVVHEAAFPMPIVILFNPWSEPDQVFLPSDAERFEYVLQDYTILCRNRDTSFPASVLREELGWQLDQFTANASTVLLRFLSELSYNSRADAAEVARHLCARVNSEEDQGLLVGKWAEGRCDKTNPEYADGEAPCFWERSEQILATYLQTGQPVKYGQCWVFAGVLTTLLRASGIPSRPITVYDAGRDFNQDQIITLVIPLSPGAVVHNPHAPTFCADSAWNFHVWCDAWMRRPDLPEPLDWQALDSSPQRNDTPGCQKMPFFKIGPASHGAIRQRATARPYDVGYLYSEVSGLLERFVQREDGSFLPAANPPDVRIGSLITTKKVGEDACVAITDEYKGEPMLRSVVAASSANERIQVRLEAPPAVVPGSQLIWRVSITNVSSVVMHCRAVFGGALLQYNGDETTSLGVFADSTYSLLPAQGTIIQKTIPESEQLAYLERATTLEARLIALDLDQDQAYSVQRRTVWISPQLNLLTSTNRLLIGEAANLTLMWTNPLSVALSNVTLSIATGSGLEIAGSNSASFSVPVILPAQTFAFVTNVTALSIGEHLVSARLHGSPLPDAFGMQSITVGSMPHLSIERTDSGMRLRFTTRSGETYRLESTPDLGRPDWTQLGQDIQGDGTEFSVIDPRFLSGRQQFYRVRLVGP